MYEALKSLLMAILRLPDRPPEPPGHGPVRVFRASPAFLRYRYVVAALSFLPATIGLAAGVGGVIAAEPGAGVALLVVSAIALVLAALLTYFTVRLDYEMRYYLVTDRSLRIREGVWVLRELTLSFVNVQHVSIQQGPIERLLGISNVIVDTAGGGGRKDETLGHGHRGILRGIEDAEAVRDRIRACLEQVHREAGLGDADELSGFQADLKLLEEIRSEARRLADAARQRASRR